jgi:hydroxymethylbilane synthase
VSRTFRVGARGSRLSLWQANHAIDKMARLGIPTELHIFSSSGDRDQGSAIADLSSDAPFADDIEDALRAGVIDAAVHSLKDMALQPRSDLMVVALLTRGSLTESLVSRDGLSLRQLPPGAVIGTSSARRRAQVLRLRPDLACRTMRGPVDERVDQVRGGLFDAALLATAGLERLDQQDAITETLALADFLPAPGQGALAVQVRADDRAARATLARLDHFPTRIATTAELLAQRALDAAGELMAAWASVEHTFITLHVRVLDRDGLDHNDAIASGIDPERVAADAVERVSTRRQVLR